MDNEWHIGINMQLNFREYSLNQWVGLAVISSLFLVENVDANILNVAILQMSKTFHTSVLTLKLAITSYLVGISVFIPISGWIADRFGARNTLLFSIALFTLMSIACGIATSIVALVIFRFLQGVAGAFMVPVGRLLLLKMFNKSQMVKASMIMSMPTILGPIMAPVLGGYLVSYFSWQYIFWVNVPLGVASFCAALKFIHNYKEEQEKFNIFGFIFLALFLGCFCFWLDLILLSEVEKVIKWLLFIAALVFGFAYYLLEKNARVQVIRYKLFKLKTFNTSFFCSVIARFALSGRSFILAIFLQMVFHLSAFQTGFFFIYMSLGVLFARGLVNLMLHKYGFKKWLTIANIGSFISLLMFSCIGSISPLLYIAMFLNGLFAAAQFMTMNVLYYADVESVDYGSAVSLASTWQQLCMSFGVIIAAGMLHFFNKLGSGSFSLNSFRLTFLGLAIISLSCQFLIKRLEPNDGKSLLNHKFKNTK